MNLLRCLTLMLVWWVLFPVAGWSAKIQEPKVEYSADSVLEMEAQTMKSHIYYAPGKQRQEMGGQDGMVMIIRRDKQVIWQLMGDMYMETAIDPADSHDLQNMDVEQTVVGEEIVNGMKTTKTKVIGTMGGKKFGGFFWTTKDGITVKMDLLYKEGDKKNRVSMELTNVKVGMQDPKLFEPPPGAVKNDMSALMGMGRGKGQIVQPDQSGPDHGRPDLGEMMKGMQQGAGEEAVDINKMMKEMMGR